MINPNHLFNKAGRQLQRNNTILWQKIFAVVQFCASAIFCIFRELISVIGYFLLLKKDSFSSRFHSRCWPVYGGRERLRKHQKPCRQKISARKVGTTVRKQLVFFNLFFATFGKSGSIRVTTLSCFDQTT